MQNYHALHYSLYRKGPNSGAYRIFTKLRKSYSNPMPLKIKCNPAAIVFFLASVHKYHGLLLTLYRPEPNSVVHIIFTKLRKSDSNPIPLKINYSPVAIAFFPASVHKSRGLFFILYKAEPHSVAYIFAKLRKKRVQSNSGKVC